MFLRCGHGRATKKVPAHRVGHRKHIRQRKGDREQRKLRALKVPGVVSVPVHPGHTLMTTITGRSSGLRVQGRRARYAHRPNRPTAPSQSEPGCDCGNPQLEANGFGAAGRSRSQRRVHGGFAPPSLMPRRNEAPAIVQSSVVRLAYRAGEHGIGCATKC